MRLTTPALVFGGDASIYYRRSVAEEWVPGALYTNSINTPALLARKSELECNLNEQDRLTALVALVVASDAFDAWGCTLSSGSILLAGGF